MKTKQYHPLEGWLKWLDLSPTEFTTTLQELNPDTKIYRENLYSYFRGRPMYDADAQEIARAMRKLGDRRPITMLMEYLRGPKVTLSLEVLTHAHA